MAEMGPRRSGAVRREAPERRRSRFTPARLVVGLAIVGSLGLIGYGLLRRDAAQIPILASGLIVLGLAQLAAGFRSAMAAYRDARIGRSGRAFAAALFGGLLVLGGALALASAIVLSLIWESA